MSRLYDRQTGQWMDVDEADVTPLVQSGSHAFEGGLDIPVVRPDGQIVQINTDRAEEAFREGGYRWATREDLRLWEQGEKEGIQQRAFGQDNMGNAAIAGGLRGFTFGASDVIAPAIAPLLGGNSEDVKSALGQTKEQYPITSAVTSVAGALANPLLRGAGNAAFKSGEGAALSLGARVTSPIAKQIVEKAGGAGVGSALEGAFFGLGDGVSEAALGDPDEVAQNLAASTVMGGLFGGAFGSAFGVGKVAAPFLKEGFKKATDAATDVVQAGIRKSAKATLVPALSLKGEKELAALVGDAIDIAPEVRDIYIKQGAGKVKEIMKRAGQLRDEVRRNVATLKSQLDDYVRGTPKNLRADLDDALVSAGGDINGALRSTFASHEAQKKILYQELMASQEPAATFGVLFDDTNTMITKLAATGDSRAISRAKKLSTWLDAQVTARGGPQNVTEGGEIILGNELRSRARQGLDKFDAQSQKILGDYIDNVTYTLRENPTFGIQQSKLDDTWEVFDKFRGFATNVTKKPSLNARDGVLRSMLTDPAKAKDFDVLLSNLEEVAPTFEKIRAAGKNLVKRQDALDELAAKIDSFRDTSMTRGFDIDDLDEVVKAINPKSDMVNKVDKLRELQAGFAEAANLGPISKLMRLQKALGQPVEKDIAELAKNESAFTTLEKIRKLSGEDKIGGNLAWDIAKRMLARSTVGATVGGYFGGTQGMAAGAAIGAIASPSQALRTLGRLEKVSQKSFSALEKANRMAIDALTSDKARKALAPAAGQAGGLENRRKNFKERAALLNRLRDPQQLASDIESRIGSSPDAPNVSAAMASQYTKTAQFLADKLPMDPLAHMALSYNKSKWEPSDFQLSQFERYVSAAENPQSVLESITRGEASPEEIETLKALYPSVYKRLQEGVLDAIMDENTELSYDQRLTIGTLFNVPTDATMSPQFIATMQANYADQPTAGSQQPPQSKSIHIELDPQAIATEVSRQTYS